MRTILAAAVASTIALMTMVPAHAGERGSFKGHAVLNSTKFAQFKALDGHPMKAAMAGELDGLIFHDGGWCS